jgi:hypothetical protein
MRLKYVIRIVEQIKERQYLLHGFCLVFLVTVCCDIRFLTATVLMDRKKSTNLGVLQKVLRVYHRMGYNITELKLNETEHPIHMILADNKFHLL